MAEVRMRHGAKLWGVPRFSLRRRDQYACAACNLTWQVGAYLALKQHAQTRPCTYMHVTWLVRMLCTRDGGCDVTWLEALGAHVH